MSFGGFLLKNFGNSANTGFRRAQAENLSIRQQQLAFLNSLRDREQAETVDSQGRAVVGLMNRQTPDAYTDPTVGVNPEDYTNYTPLPPPPPPPPPTAGLRTYGAQATYPQAGVAPAPAAPAQPAQEVPGKDYYIEPPVVAAAPPRPTKADITKDPRYIKRMQELDAQHVGKTSIQRDGVIAGTLSRLQKEWDDKYKSTHNADGSPINGLKLTGTSADYRPSTTGPTTRVAQPTKAAVTTNVLQAAQQYNFAGLEQKYGLPPNFLMNMLAIENPNVVIDAKNPNSSATGLFQFIKDTAARYGVNPLDPVSSAEGAARYAVDNAIQMRQTLGRDPAPWEVYMAHQQGAAGALALIMNPTRKATSLVGRAQVLTNGGTENMTAQEFLQIYANKFGSAGAVAAQGGAPAQQGQQPTQQYAGMYTGGSTVMSPTQMVAQSDAPVPPAEIIKNFQPGVMTNPGAEYTRAKNEITRANALLKDMQQSGVPPQMIATQLDKIEQLKLIAKRSYWEASVYALTMGDPAMIDSTMSEALGQKIRHIPMSDGSLKVIVNGKEVGITDIDTVASQARRTFDQAYEEQYTEYEFKRGEKEAEIAGQMKLEAAKGLSQAQAADIKGRYDLAAKLTDADSARLVALIKATNDMDMKMLDFSQAKLVNGGNNESYFVVPNPKDPSNPKIFVAGTRELNMDGTKVTKPVWNSMQIPR